MDYGKYQPSGGTFEKGARLLETAMRDKAVAEKLMRGTDEEKLALLEEFGLSTDELLETAKLINQYFNNRIQTGKLEAIFW